MKVEVLMPKMGESLQEGTILKWLKKEGEAVERDEMILEISTDKVDTEVPSPVSGVLSQILYPENETVEVGKVIAYIETEGKAEAKPAEAKETLQQDAPVPQVVEQKVEIKEKATPTSSLAATGNLVDVVMPKMGESLQEGTILKWLKKEGDAVERDEMILEISTDKVDTEVPSPVSGVIVQILAQENETVEVGKVIAKISLTDGNLVSHTAETSQVSVEKTEPEKEEATIQPVVQDSPQQTSNRFYSPLVKTIAKAEGISFAELDTIQGTGAEGRVTKADLLKYIEDRKKAPSVVPQSVVTEQKQPEAPKVTVKSEPSPVVTPPTVGSDIEIIPMDRVRQLIAEHMIYSKHTSAHVTSVAEADVTGIVKFREKHKTEFEKREGFKLTFTPFFAKAAVDGIRAFPRVNVSVDGKNIILHKRIHLSVATALEDGNLIVPVIKNADALSISGLARAVYDLSTRARTKKLNPDDIQGGTFTITNVGTFGTLFGTPVINQPQTAIMGIGAIKKRPVVREIDGEDLIVVRHIAFVSITYDHRVIDGQLAGQCLAAIVKSLESMNENTISI